MSASVIGKFSTFNRAADAIRRASPYAAHPYAAHNDSPIRPAAATDRAGAEFRHRDSGITIDLRPDPPEDAAQEAAKRAFERAGQPGQNNNGRGRDRGAATASHEPARTYRANPDTPFRQRTSEQTYQAVEAVDAPVSHRGGIYDRQI